VGVFSEHSISRSGLLGPVCAFNQEIIVNRLIEQNVD